MIDWFPLLAPHAISSLLIMTGGSYMMKDSRAWRAVGYISGTGAVVLLIILSGPGVIA